MPLAQINAILREIKGTRLLNQKKSHVIKKLMYYNNSLYKTAKTKKIICIVISKCILISHAYFVHTEESLEMDLSSFALRLYEGKILNPRSSNGKCKKLMCD